MKINKSIILSALLWGLVCPIVNAQVKYLTLDECHSLALKHNAKLKIEKLNVISAQEDKKQAFSGYFPSISGIGMGFNANKGIIKMDLAPGQSMSLLKNGLTAGITATQPVFAGGQIVNGNKLANLNTEVKQLQQIITENEVSLNTETYYWQLVSLKEKLKTLQSLQNMLNQLFLDVDISVKAGIKTHNDILQIQLEQNSIKSKIVNLTSSISLSKQILAQYIGIINEEIDITESISFNTLITSPAQWKVNHKKSIYNTNEYKMLEKNVTAKKLQHKLSIGKNLPTLAIGAGYIYNNFMDKDEAFGLLYATISIPISDWWGGSHNIKKHKTQINISETQLIENSELLEIRMQKVWIELEDAYKQIMIANNSIEQSKENLRIHNDYYKAGTCSMSDLLKAQSLYQQSKDKYVEAYSTYQIKKLEYIQVTGR